MAATISDMPETISKAEPQDDELSAALRSVEAALERIKGCTDSEREALAADIRGLREMAAKLRDQRVEIAIFGEISTGKSALINALVGRAATAVDIRGGWTKDVWHVTWEGVGYCVPGFENSSIVLLDTPGLNEVDGASRTAMARDVAGRADLVLFVTDSDLNETEYSALVELAASYKPLILVLNKADLYTPDELDSLLTLFREKRLAGLVDPANIVTTKADPRRVEYIIESADGSTRSEWRKPPVQIDELRERIVEVLERDGKELVALNASMFAADRSDRMAALRVQLRSEKATQLIWTYAGLKAVAVALNPHPAFDVVGGSAIDATMVIMMGRMYGIEITKTGAVKLVTSILKAAGWVIAGELAVSWTSSLIKGLTLGASTVLTALPQGVAAGYGSYIVGQAARYYFENGASWGDQGAKHVVKRILDHTDKQSVIENLKEKIRAKLSTNQYAGKKETMNEKR